MRKSLALALAVLFSLGLQAQEIDTSTLLESEFASKLETSTTKEDQQNSAELQVSPATDVPQDPQLLALVPFLEVTSGACLVIGDMLVQFCQSHPEDTSCQPQ